ncbi:MAG: NUDIX domain-containing protein [Candidatus Saccharimonadales bacterium]|jgi:8-oxo-dGTP pyrophosphatase MutT (NUDIX family)
MSRRINVRGIIHQDGTLFAVRHKRPEGSASFWCTPGGGLDDGESLEDGLRRELREETGVDAVIGRLAVIQQFKKSPDENYPYDEFLEFFFVIDNPEDFAKVSLTGTSHGEAELAAYGFVAPRDVDLLPGFLQEIDFGSFADQTAPIRLYNEL